MLGEACVAECSILFRSHQHVFGVMWLHVNIWPRCCSSVDGITCSFKFAWVVKQLQILWCSAYGHSVLCEFCHICCVGAQFIYKASCKLLFNSTKNFLDETNHTLDILHYFYMCILSAIFSHNSYHLQFQSPIPMASIRQNCFFLLGSRLVLEQKKTQQKTKTRLAQIAKELVPRMFILD